MRKLLRGLGLAVPGISAAAPVLSQVPASVVGAILRHLNVAHHDLELPAVMDSNVATWQGNAAPRTGADFPFRARGPEGGPVDLERTDAREATFCPGCPPHLAPDGLPIRCA
ncbi:MAG: hypothetical protein E2O39_05520 [Planctomycetota bacterium]|nr:MAG: hypothetical protein E2O39_05520 [Planctomycetota bacterium]